MKIIYLLGLLCCTAFLHAQPSPRLDSLRNNIIRHLTDSALVAEGWISVDAPPFINAGTVSTNDLCDSMGRKIVLPSKFGWELALKWIDYFREANRDGHRENTMIIRIVSKNQVEIYTFFNQALIDKFEKDLPAEKRGKIKAWYMSQ